MSRRDKLLVFGPQNLTDLYFDVYLRGIIFKAIRSAPKACSQPNKSFSKSKRSNRSPFYPSYTGVYLAS